jgi:RNA-binding protein PNO1
VKCRPIKIRSSISGKKVELKTKQDTPDVSNLQKCADFVHAFILGFDIADALALLRMDDWMNCMSIRLRSRT